MAVPTGVWASTRKKVYRYRRQEFFAENGLVHVLDKDTGAYSPVSVRDFLIRARGFNQELSRDDGRWADERVEQQRMVEDMIKCCRQARQQGDPFDPRVLKSHAHRKRAGRIVVPGVPDPSAPRRAPILLPGT